jgi:hypothetical protein
MQVRSKFVAAVLGVSLALSTMTAYAERPRGTDYGDSTCQAIYDHIQNLLDAYWDAADTPSGPDILTELRKWGKQYQDLGCEERFGPITRMPDKAIRPGLVAPGASLTHAE